MIICVAVCYKFCQISSLLLLLVNSSHHGKNGSASAWPTRGRDFKPVLKRYNFSGKNPSAKRASRFGNHRFLWLRVADFWSSLIYLWLR